MIYSARQAVEDAGSNSSSRMNALARIAFDKHLSDARKHVVGAMKAQAAFWEALQSPRPNIGAMHIILKVMHSSMEASERAFKGLLAINNSSLMVLRMVSYCVAFSVLYVYASACQS